MPGSQSKHLVVLPADLVQVLQRCGIGDDHVHQRRQIGYLSGYLGDIGAKTAVIENEYIDRDFLEDHVLYYSRCFHDYDRKCHRVHFFSKVYSEEDIDEIIVGGNADGFHDFTASYLGFVVVRPLPETIVGRTCLVPYVENGATDRHYKALCDTGVSFFWEKTMRSLYAISGAGFSRGSMCDMCLVGGILCYRKSVRTYGSLPGAYHCAGDRTWLVFC